MVTFLTEGYKGWTPQKTKSLRLKMLEAGFLRVEIISVAIVTFNLALALTPSVTLVAKEVSLNGPTLFPSDARLQNQRAVLALEALQMIIPVHCSQPGSLRLPLLWHNCLFAACAHHTELPRVILCAVDPVV